MRKKIFNAFQYVFFLGFGLFLLWLSAKNLSEENKAFLKVSLQNADYGAIAFPMLILLLSHYIRALRWKVLIKPLGYAPRTVNTFFATMLGYFFNLMVPRLGEIMKCTILAKHEKIPADKLIGTMVTERVCDFICLVIIFFITIFIQFDLIHSFASGRMQALFYDNNGFKISKLLIILGALLFAILLFRWAFRKYASSKLMQKVLKLLKGVWAGISSIRYLKNKWIFLAQTAAIWSLYILSVKAGFLTMEAVRHLGFDACFSIISFGSLAMMATQGGIGAYQIAIQKLLPIYGIAEGPSLAFGWILWIAQTGIVIFVGIICLIFLPVINRNKHEISATH